MDLVGNENTASFTAEFTVAGTPDFYPVNPNLEYYYFEEGADLINVYRGIDYFLFFFIRSIKFSNK